MESGNVVRSDNSPPLHYPSLSPHLGSSVKHRAPPLSASPALINSIINSIEKCDNPFSCDRVVSRPVIVLQR